MHVPAFFPVYPASHSHAKFVVLPVGEMESDGQSEHATDPGLDLYLPATQAEQLPFVPVHPALQTHAVTAVLPAGEDEFKQAVQPPVPDPYVPARQTQLPDIGTVETVSIPHNVHVFPSPREPSLQVRHTVVITSGITARGGHLPDAGTHEHAQVLQFPSTKQKDSHGPAYKEQALDAYWPRPIKRGSTQAPGEVTLSDLCPTAQLVCAQPIFMYIQTTKIVTRHHESPIARARRLLYTACHTRCAKVFCGASVLFCFA